MANIEEKMKKLEDKMSDGREDQLEEVISMKKSLKMALLKKNFADHPAMIQLLSLLRKREQSFSTLLQNKEDLNEEKRMAMFQRRKEVRFMLSFFDVDKTITGIEAQLDYQLSDELSPHENGIE